MWMFLTGKLKASSERNLFFLPRRTAVFYIIKRACIGDRYRLLPLHLILGGNLSGFSYRNQTKLKFVFRPFHICSIDAIALLHRGASSGLYNKSFNRTTFRELYTSSAARRWASAASPLLSVLWSPSIQRVVRVYGGVRVMAKRGSYIGYTIAVCPLIALHSEVCNFIIRKHNQPIFIYIQSHFSKFVCILSTYKEFACLKFCNWMSPAILFNFRDRVLTKQF